MNNINKSIHEDITFDALYIEYIHYRNLRPETIRSYTRKLTIYSNITGMTLTQLIEEAESDEDLGFRKRLRRIKGHLLDILNLTGFIIKPFHMMKRLNRFKIQLKI
ncbi:MAG: hypothetical protein WAK14_00480 [Methanobacterium sp.]